MDMIVKLFRLKKQQLLKKVGLSIANAADAEYGLTVQEKKQKKSLSQRNLAAADTTSLFRSLKYLQERVARQALKITVQPSL